MIQPGRDRCELCSCHCGEPHQPGCAGEECPVCGGMLIGCRCQMLSPRQGEQIVHALYRQLDNLESALRAADDGDVGLGNGASYLQHAAMRYIFENIPDETRQEIVRAFHLRFPGLVPQLQDDEGRGYYTAEQLAEALDIPLSEINERIEAMVEVGNGLNAGDGRKLRKVH